MLFPGPHCGEVKRVIRYGTNRSGTPRCRCKACAKTFTLSPKGRAMTPQREQAILGALAERLSQRGIARALRVSCVTIQGPEPCPLGE